jgi:L-lactate dehydrogenase complex protein LldE
MGDPPRPRRVSLFVTCLVDLLFPEVGVSTVLLLRDLGFEVDFPRGQTCCGQPAFNSGFTAEARRTAATLLDAFEGADAVVAPSGSCVSMVRKHLPALFAGSGDEERGRSLAGRTWELSEFLVDVCGIENVAGASRRVVTYHDSCHGLRDLGLRSQGRKLLAGIEGLEIREMARAEQCCGFGGTFSLRAPEVATAMADDKLEQAADTGATAMVGADAGCLMHLAGRASRSGSPLNTIHLAELLAEARGLRRPS